jgi:hypothetical protein
LLLAAAQGAAAYLLLAAALAVCKLEQQLFRQLLTRSLSGAALPEQLLTETTAVIAPHLVLHQQAAVAVVALEIILVKMAGLVAALAMVQQAQLVKGRLVRATTVVAVIQLNMALPLAVVAVARGRLAEAALSKVFIQVEVREVAVRHLQLAAPPFCMRAAAAVLVMVRVLVDRVVAAMAVALLLSNLKLQVPQTQAAVAAAQA